MDFGIQVRVYKEKLQLMHYKDSIITDFECSPELKCDKIKEYFSKILKQEVMPKPKNYLEQPSPTRRLKGLFEYIGIAQKIEIKDGNIRVFKNCNQESMDQIKTIRRD